MRRCVDSGLWVPDGGKAKEPEKEEEGNGDQKNDEKEVYSEVDETPTPQGDGSTPV